MSVKVFLNRLFIIIYACWSRWVSNPSLRRYEWGFSERYWKWRSFFQMRWFTALRRRFEISEWHRSKKESTSVLGGLVKLIIPEFFLIVGMMFILWISEYLFFQRVPPLLKMIGWDTWAIKIENLSRFEPDAKVFVIIGGIVAPLAGVFLSIFFAAVSIVASTVYAKSPNSIRQMFMHERASGFYMRMLSRCVCVGLLALGVGVWEQPLGFLNLILIVFLTFFGVLSFGKLGLRTLDFFDPARLTDYLERDLAKWIIAATPDGYQWNSPSFQDHYQKKTEHALRTYGDIIELAKEQKPLCLGELLCRATLFLPLYIRLKRRIPTNSRWFKQRHKHLNWLTANSSQTNVALQADVTLKPELAPDYMWFEEQFETFLLDGFRTLLDDQQGHNANTVAFDVQRTLYSMSKNLAVDEALRLHRAFGEAIREYISKTATGDINANYVDDRYNLDLLDCYAHGVIQVLLGVCSQITKMNIENFGKTIACVKWEKPKSIYRYRLPRIVVKQLESLQKGVCFERTVEGRQCTPDWYLNELAAAAFVEFLQKAVSDIMAEVEMCFDHNIDISAEGNPARQATLIEIGLEACNKCFYHFSQLRSWQEGMTQAYHREPELPWPDIKWDELDSRVHKCRMVLLEKYATIAPSLISLPITDDWPDFYGHAYNVLAQECYVAMAEGNETLFAQIYMSCFQLFLTAPTRIRPLLDGQSDRIKMVYSTESLVDLMCLSGLAKIYSELDEKKFWAATEAIWNNYLEKHPNGKKFIESIFAAVNIRDSIPSLTPRCTLRTNWKLDVHRRLSARGLTGWVQPPIFSGGNRSKPPHRSLLINVLTEDDIPLMDSPDDIFIALYLAVRPEANGLVIPSHAKMFISSMEHLRKSIEEDGQQ